MPQLLPVPYNTKLLQYCQPNMGGRVYHTLLGVSPVTIKSYAISVSTHLLKTGSLPNSTLPIS